jgi:hypothetical protein
VNLCIYDIKYGEEKLNMKIKAKSSIGYIIDKENELLTVDSFFEEYKYYVKTLQITE